MTVLVTGLLLATVAASFGETYAFATYRALVWGSHPRYVWRTRYILLAWTVIVLCVALAVIDIVGGEVLFAGIWLTVGAFRAMQLYVNRNSDDDDWFTGRGRKIWAGVKRTIARLAPQPRPMPVPVPA